jgi:hypothetical protein
LFGPHLPPPSSARAIEEVPSLFCPFSPRQWLYTSPLNGSLLAPPFRLAAPDISLRPSSTQQRLYSSWLDGSLLTPLFPPDNNSTAFRSTAFSLCPSSAQWQLCNFPFDGSLLAPLFHPMAPNVSLCPSSTRQCLAPLCLTMDPLALDPPLLCALLPLSCLRYIRIQSSSQHLRFALGAMNPRLEGSVVKRNDSTPFLHDRMFPLFCLLIVRLCSLVSFSRP